MADRVSHSQIEDSTSIESEQQSGEDDGQHENSEIGNSSVRFRSKIWKYFNYLVKENESECKSCKFKLAGRYSTNLKQHLKSKHKKIHEEYVKLQEEDEKSQQALKQKKQATKRMLGLSSSDNQGEGTIKKVRHLKIS